MHVDETLTTTVTQYIQVLIGLLMVVIVQWQM